MELLMNMSGHKNVDNNIIHTHVNSSTFHLFTTGLSFVCFNSLLPLPHCCMMNSNQPV